MRAVRFLVVVALGALALPTVGFGGGADHNTLDAAGVSFSVPGTGGGSLDVQVSAATSARVNGGDVTVSFTRAEISLFEYDLSTGQQLIGAFCEVQPSIWTISRVRSARLVAEGECVNVVNGEPIPYAIDLEWTAVGTLSGHGRSIDKIASMTGTVTIAGTTTDLDGASGGMTHIAQTDPLSTGRLVGGGGGGVDYGDGSLACFGEDQGGFQENETTIHWSRSSNGRFHVGGKGVAHINVGEYRFDGPFRFAVSFVPQPFDEFGYSEQSVRIPITFVREDGATVEAFYEYLLIAFEDPNLGGLGWTALRVTCGPTLRPPVN